MVIYCHKVKEEIIMKATGYVRNVDELGRIVIPKELRKAIGIIDDESAVEIFRDGDTLILKKNSESCVFCSKINPDVDFSGKKICKSCFEKIKNL